MLSCGVAAECEHGLVSTGIERMKVCLNGGRGRADHPAVPLTPAELAASAVAAVAAGATAVHLHPRRADGGESLLPTDVAAAVTAVRQACPATPVGVSTGLWITGGGPGGTPGGCGHMGGPSRRCPARLRLRQPVRTRLG